MKHTLIAMLACILALFTGCKTVPTVDVMERTSKSIGVAAGYVANQLKIDDKTRNAVVAVLGEVSKAVPAEGQSFEEAWTPIAAEAIAKLVEEGKLNDGQAAVAKAAVAVVTKALDYEFTVRYPKARQYEELVAAAVRGFTDGFLSVFTPAEMFKTAPAVHDEEAYEYLTK